MPFKPETPAKPFSKLAASAVAPALALSGVGFAVYGSVQDPSFLPLGIAFAVLAGLESVWAHASQR